MVWNAPLIIDLILQSLYLINLKMLPGNLRAIQISGGFF
jgi:hypothetical protein